jgi:hypothetical protein
LRRVLSVNLQIALKGSQDKVGRLIPPTPQEISSQHRGVVPEFQGVPTGGFFE